MECKKKAKECHYFVSIIGPKYGEEIEGKSFCEHEFDEAYNENPDKIIVYVIEGDITRWSSKQQDFLKKSSRSLKKAYARGDRINKQNIKKRFEKDLIERIAYFSKRVLICNPKRQITVIMRSGLRPPGYATFLPCLWVLTVV